MKARTRIAPSPTGQIHIGTIRTSLYDYALAKKTGGQFIIRIEDTDKKRQVDGAVEAILDMHESMGIVADESPFLGGPYAPYTQSERLELYRKYAQQLIDQDHAYYCFCTPERLEQVKKEQQAQGVIATKYDKHCLNLSKEQVAEKLKNNESYVIRLKVPTDEIITWHDEVYGDISVPSNDLDDQVLIKSDGFPTYHLAVVVDDYVMKITHILRGNDWIPSTPKHVLLYKYFGWEMPIHVHLPNLKEVGGNKKLSKRFGSVAMYEFLKEGYLPKALLNLFMFLGWNPGTEKEIYTLEEFVNDFSIERIQKTDLVSFDRKKLLWYNGYYIRALPPEELWNVLKTWAKRFEFNLLGSGFDEAYISSALKLVQDRMHVLTDFNDLMGYFFDDPSVNIDALVSHSGDKARAASILADFYALLNSVESANWQSANLDSLCHDLIKEKGYKPKEAFMTLREAVTGKSATPPIFDILEVLNKEIVLRRINNLISSL